MLIRGASDWGLKKMWVSVLRQKAREVVVRVLMTHPRTIATPASHSTRSLILRPRSLPSSSSCAPPRCSTFSATTMSTTSYDPSLDALFKQKKILRARVKRDLKSMDPTLRSQEDDAIQKIILEAPWFKSCRRLCAYISCSALREVDTSKVLLEILQNPAQDSHSPAGKKLYVPRVEDKNRHMRMLHIQSIDELIANSMNILEPAPVDVYGNDREDVVLANDPVDMLLLPGLAFDKSGRRLGRGGGYYDTFLANYQNLANERKWKQPLLIALSYSSQILDEDVIPVTPNDVFIDALVTPSGVIYIRSGASEKCP